jgi:uncharacterized membrane protein YfhO
VAPDTGRRGAARITTDEPDRVQIDVTDCGGGWLVLADTYFPGWRAEVDGVERSIVRANVAFRAVPLAPTDRLVTFEYRPTSVRVGGAISLMALASLIALAWPRRAREPISP